MPYITGIYKCHSDQESEDYLKIYSGKSLVFISFTENHPIRYRDRLPVKATTLLKAIS